MNPIEKKKLKAQAHALNPVVIIGQAGLTAAVVNEINLALDTHELIKVRIRAERNERKLIGEQICSNTSAEMVQSIGQIAVFYRKNPRK
ncbi:MAG: YhbY family RNA-binding protein [Methylococcales bacterium]|nr:YhbY family RNA-binding protein [Methylococcales bacterium]